MNTHDNNKKEEPLEKAAHEGSHEGSAKGSAKGSAEASGDVTARGRKLMKGPAALIVAAIAVTVMALSLYLIFTGMGGPQGGLMPEHPTIGLDPEDALELNVFYPLEGKVKLETRLVRKVTGVREIAAASIVQWLSGPLGDEPSYVPDAVELLGVYIGQDDVLYVDFNSALALNFQGDAVAEFLLLRALYKTLSANSYGVRGYRVLVDGREVDTIGGHIYILGGIERAVPYRLLEEDEIEK